MAAVGIDACKAGWVAVVLRDDTAPTIHLLTEIGQVVDAVPDAQGIAIDIPIGLPLTGRREADMKVRAELGPRRNSLFITPPRAALEAESHERATALATQLTGVGISQQAFALRTKIFQVEQWLARARCDVWEVHPELSFTLMLGHPARASKKSWSGMIERRAALAEQGLNLDHVDSEVGALIGMDDVLDAGAAAWSARRLIAGAAESFPDPPEVGPTGRPIAVWA